MAFGHWQVRNDRLLCRLPRKTVAVKAPAGLLGAVMALCDGRMAWKEVAAELGLRWSAHSVEAFLSRLSHEGVLVEAGETLACWTDIGQLPQLHPRVASPLELPQLHRVAQARLLPGAGLLSPGTTISARALGLAELLQERESYRTFADTPVSAATLGSILWAAHGVARPAADGALKYHRTVASGGNMHSARWFVFVLRPLHAGDDAAEELQPGLYEARFHVEGGASFQLLKAGAAAAWRVVVDPRVLRFASALVLPVADVSVPARKYGNRATLFASVETGQSLQNAQLMATALGAAAMVRGDTAATVVMDILLPHVASQGGPKNRYLVMPALVVGSRPSPVDVARQRQDDWIKVGTASTLPESSGQDPGFAFFAGPVIEGETEIYATGRSADPRVAVLKAEAEAWERQGWATLGSTVAGVFKDVEGAIDPSALVAYRPEQYDTPGFPLKPFSARRKYLWCSALHVESGDARRVPAEFVHALSALPRAYRANACTNSSTSGVAAWTDVESALCRGTLELVERDAFLRAWLGRQSPARIATSTLPREGQLRVAALEAAGHTVAIAQIGDRFVPVFSVFLQATARPFTAVTAAADFEAERALAKALDEAEGRAAHAAAFPAKPLTSPRDVQSTIDVNRFYQSRRFFRRSDFYAQGPVSGRFGAQPMNFCADWKALKARVAQDGLDLFAVDITPAGAALDQGRTALHVVRALIPGLLPIWFQHGMEPAGLPVFQASRPPLLNLQRRPSDSAFVHPFT